MSIIDLRLSDLTKDQVLPIVRDIEIVGMREDYNRKRNWCIIIDKTTGQIKTGYYGRYYYRPDEQAPSCERSYHPVFRAELSVGELYRGQSSFQLTFHTPHNDQQIEIGATGVCMLLKAIAEGKVDVVAGRFVLNFVLEKKGENVYAEPYFGEIKDLI
ncbi:hypothetical protein Aeh1ORF307c [Aeromonas phage Aeh1]|uniref:Uncharacterized protein n=1 Tax=Aeromonas phage Aeh1 TaxID=2880362 RepID=Q76YB9_9CAUD|nr:hypothetical protein Aeh1p326 [Aeromonas phage Aeh1]AAQ17976.1 hypothetical protein Aeh1ORF307c [Aeromonas phage Aeh1]